MKTKYFAHIKQNLNDKKNEIISLFRDDARMPPNQVKLSRITELQYEILRASNCDIDKLQEAIDGLKSLLEKE